MVKTQKQCHTDWYNLVGSEDSIFCFNLYSPYGYDLKLDITRLYVMTDICITGDGEKLKLYPKMSSLMEYLMVPVTREHA